MSRTIAETIKRNLKTFHADADYVASKSKFNKPEFEAELNRLKEHTALYFNFHFTKARLRLWKARRGELSPVTEKRLVEHGRQALASYHDAVTSAKKIHRMLHSSGMSRPLERHMPVLCAHLDHNPHLPAMIEQFREMGAPESAIQCVYNQVAEKKFNLLQFSNDGTFDGLMKKLDEEAKRVETSVDVMAAHGLPTIEGASGGEVGVILAVVVIVGMLILVFEG